jgi:hypothetical protein
MMNETSLKAQPLNLGHPLVTCCLRGCRISPCKVLQEARNVTSSVYLVIFRLVMTSHQLPGNA